LEWLKKGLGSKKVKRFGLKEEVKGDKDFD
jgi:hypothetical protein